MAETDVTKLDYGEDYIEQATQPEHSMPSPEEQVIHSCFCLLVCENFIRII